MFGNQTIPSIIDHIHNGIITVDQAKRITTCNATAKTILGLKEPVIGKPITSLDLESKVFEVVSTDPNKSGLRYVADKRIFAVTHEPIMNGETEEGAIVLFQDITAMEKLTDELETCRRNFQLMEDMMNYSYDGMIITDGEGIVIKINESLLRATNLSAEHYLGEKIDSLYTKGYFFSEPIAKLARVNKKVTTGITRIRTGKEVMVTSTPVFNSNGKVAKVVTNIRDMTDIVRLQQRLNQLPNTSSRAPLGSDKTFQRELLAHEVVTCHPELQKTLELAKRISGMDVTVLLQGETGVGKEVFARLIHNWSQRKGDFFKVNCGAIPSTLLESELFGYSGGAFTGANKNGKPGFFELAENGTLFLDEIEDLPLDLQGKFLRVLQDKEFVRLGGTKAIKANVRLIAASNRDLKQMVKDGAFRIDLYYRLNVLPIHISPLRERKEDIPLLVTYFLGAFNKKYGVNKVITPELVNRFAEYPWPGNVRELMNVIERLVITSESDVIRDNLLVGAIAGLFSTTGDDAAPAQETELEDDSLLSLKEAVALTEKRILTEALKKYKKSRIIGQALGISHTAVLKKMKKYQIF